MSINLEYKKLYKIYEDKEQSIYIYIKKILGQGTNGIVYSACMLTKENKKIKSEEVAMKLMRHKDENDKLSEIINNKLYDNCQGLLEYKFYGELKKPFSIDNKIFQNIIIYKIMNKTSLYNYILELNNISYKNYIEILEKIYNIYDCLIKNNYGYTDLKPENLLINLHENKANIYLGDLDGLSKSDSKIIELMTLYTTTFNYPLIYGNIKMLMTWEFIVFTLLINPMLNIDIISSIAQIFAWYSKADLKNGILNAKFLKNKKQTTFTNDEKDDIKRYIPTEIINIINTSINNFNRDDFELQINNETILFSDTINIIKSIIEIYKNHRRATIDSGIIFQYKNKKSLIKGCQNK